MKKIYSFKVMLIYLLFATLFGILSMIFLFNNNVSSIPGYILLALALCFVAIIFLFPNYIIIENNNILIINNPILSTNRIYKAKQSLISWNNNINIDEIENIEIVTLSKSDKDKYIGHKHIFNKYFKIKLKNSNSFKYIYISIYSNKQIKKFLLNAKYREYNLK